MTSLVQIHEFLSKSYIFYEVANSALFPDVTERCYQVNVIYQISLI